MQRSILSSPLINTESQQGDLFATPDPVFVPPPEPPTLDLPCFVCKGHGMHLVVGTGTRSDPLVVCAACRTNAPASLTALELRLVDQEELLAQACMQFDMVLEAADPIDQQRYDRMRDAISAAIGDPDLWERVKAAQERARAKGDGLSAILAAEADCHRVATRASAAMGDINEVFYTLHRLKEAQGWEVPAEATERRRQLGQPYPVGTPPRRVMQEAA